ncbi:MAG: addiction module protein [Cyanobacteriota bacterium]|nr:addiction module protein [Cyanobacteriota bacterium]
MRSIEQITEELLSLPSASRVLLVEKLVESLEFDTDPEIQTAWLSEAKRRRDEVRDGSVEVIRGDEALIKLHQGLQVPGL